MAAQPGNVNAVRTGHRGRGFGLVHAKLGRRFAGAYADVCKLGIAVERLVRQKHGSLSLWHAARIQTLQRIEESARAAEYSIHHNQEMGPDELRQQRDAIVRWTQQRDNLLRELLGDDQKTGGTDLWGEVDRLVAERGSQDGRSDAAGTSGGSADVDGASNAQSEATEAETTDSVACRGSREATAEPPLPTAGHPAGDDLHQDGEAGR